MQPTSAESGPEPLSFVARAERPALAGRLVAAAFVVAGGRAWCGRRRGLALRRRGRGGRLLRHLRCRRGHGHEASAKLAWGRVMARRTILALAAAGGLALSLLTASSALAGSAFDEVLKDYQSDGQIDACSHSDKTLRDAQHQIPNDMEQYPPDFPEALSKALRERASGACAKAKAGGTSTTASGGTGASSGGAAGGGGTRSAPPPSGR